MSDFTGMLEKERGIDLALDPNLISLPLHNPSTGKSSSTEQESVLSGGISSEHTLESKYKSPLLVNNPYEIFSHLPLNQLIPLILQQQGPGFKFADLSEEGLLQEIKKSQILSEKENKSNSNESESMDVDFPSELVEEQISESTQEPTRSPTSETVSLIEPIVNNPDTFLEQITQDQFFELKREMIDSINLAMNESSLALEFVSLLLSSSRESAAASSMSPYLKKTVHVASLNSDRVPLEEKSSQDLLALSVLNKGWKLKSLNESRQMLKDNYTKLSSTLEREHEYWRRISKYISNKDVIFKLRDKATSQKVLGIKYGYEDSGSTYKHDRGIASLKNNSDTNRLELIPSSKNSADLGEDSQYNEKFIRIRIFTKIESEDDSVLSGESSLDKIFLEHQENADPEDIRNQISRLKAFIFEKELMYRLKKECSQLISYGVTVENENKIVVELSNEKIEIEYLSLQDNSVINHEQDAPKVNDKRANLMLITFRMLLVVMFKKEIRQRLESSKRTISPNVDKDLLLIRPILGKIRHNNYKMLLNKILKDYVLDVIKDSKIKVSAFSTEKEPHEKPRPKDKNIQKLSDELSAFDDLLNIPISYFTLSLRNKSKFMITLKSPNYCNAIVVIKYINSAEEVVFDTEFSEFKEIEEFLNFIVTEYIKNREKSPI